MARPTQVRRASPSPNHSKRGPRLRESSFGDFEQISELGSRNGLALAGSYEEWSHLWLGNPAYRELESRWPIGWVLEDESERIVASMENIPLWYEIDERRVLAASGRAWAADAEHRSAALLLLEAVINQADVELYINTTFSPASTPAVTVFGCTRVPVGVWDQAAFWITDHQHFVESYLTRQGYTLARPLSYPLSSVVSAYDLLQEKPLRPGDVAVRPCTAFDERFDEFWFELRERSRHVLLAVRTREMLDWHYRYALRHGRLWIATVLDGHRLVAYAVFDRRDRTDINLRRVRLVDFQSLDGGTELLLPVLSWALRRCRAEGMHVLECVGRWMEQGALLDELAPHRRALPAWRYVYRANTAELAERLRDRHAWAPSLYDGDASLTR